MLIARDSLLPIPSREALVLFHSPDCRQWRLDETDPVLSLFELHWRDGRVVRPLARLDQPQLWFDETGGRRCSSWR